MKKLLLLVLMTYSFYSAAQTGSIAGTVKTSDQKPAQFVNIVIKDSDIAGVTDKGGAFFLSDIPAGDQTIVFSSIGFKTLEKHVQVKSDETTTLNIILEESVDELGMVEVFGTASRISEKANEVPSTLTMISEKEVERQSEISTNLPALLMQKIPSISPSEESQNNFIGKIRGRDFLVLIDGVPQSTPLRNGGRDLKSIDITAIERIEVVNGASAMYGNGGAGGIINYVTKKAPRNDAFSSTTNLNGSINLVDGAQTAGYNLSQTFAGDIGSFDYLVSGKIGETGVSRSADGEIISPFYGIGETDTYNALAKLGYDFSDEHRIEFMANYYKSVQDSKYVGTPGEFGVSPSIGVLGDSDIRGGTPYNNTYSLKYEGQFKRTEAVLSAYYNDFKTIFEGWNQIYSTNKGVRLNFNTPFSLGEDKSLSLIYGLDVLKDYTAQKTLEESFVTPDMDMSSIAPYLQSKFTFNNDWIFKAGLRFENIKFEVGDLTTSEGEVVEGESDRYNAIVFNAGARYNRLSFLQPFISFSQGYSIGDVGLILRNGVPLSAINAKPVVVDNYELGISGRCQIFNYQLAGYYSYSERGTRFSEVSPGVYDATQLPQRIYGLEIVLGAQPTSWLHIGGTLGYMDGKEDVDNDGDFKGEIDNSNLSPRKITANADFKITKDFNFLLQMVNIGSRDVFPPEEYNYGRYPISGYTLFDMYVSYQLKNMLITFSVNNLFNQDYFPVHSEVRGANFEGRYYVKGRGATANIGIKVSL
ncbi:TonB-dependent receptor [Galbibacter sp. EGI 63066]|uniref:TonB-dependent receptor n=1 Tax=Galbibacter sp. EGI 63066 TaxID=2993559 RepID=UPI002248DE3E|nr:TonB-dependent receptor [Galbibacter sp. EGI 63066]MCX2681126.1 TonB-dependent receptor [Galbibacter sp. EGI 63066]